MQQEEERQALIDLYNLCKGEEWYRLENWCSGNGLEAWHGVTTDRTTGRIIRLNLDSNNLTDDISKWRSVASFTQLKYLDLYNKILQVISSSGEVLLN